MLVRMHDLSEREHLMAKIYDNVSVCIHEDRHAVSQPGPDRVSTQTSPRKRLAAAVTSISLSFALALAPVGHASKFSSEEKRSFAEQHWRAFDALKFLAALNFNYLECMKSHADSLPAAIDANEKITVALNSVLARFTSPLGEESAREFIANGMIQMSKGVSQSRSFEECDRFTRRLVTKKFPDHIDAELTAPAVTEQ